MVIRQKEKKPLHLAKMNIKKGDTVLIIKGKDKGKQGTVSRALPQVSKVIVEGLNIAKKHIRPQGQTRQEGVIDKATAVQRVEPGHLDSLLHPMIDPAAQVDLLATGLLVVEVGVATVFPAEFIVFKVQQYTGPIKTT